MGDIADEFEKMHPIDVEMLEFLKILDAELASGTEGARGIMKTGFIEELTFSERRSGYIRYIVQHRTS